MNLSNTARAIFSNALAECDIESAFRRKCVVDCGEAVNRFTLQGGLHEPAVSVDLGAFDRILAIADRPLSFIQRLTHLNKQLNIRSFG